MLCKWQKQPLKNGHLQYACVLTNVKFFSPQEYKDTQNQRVTSGMNNKICPFCLQQLTTRWTSELEYNQQDQQHQMKSEMSFETRLRWICSRFIKTETRKRPQHTNKRAAWYQQLRLQEGLTDSTENFSDSPVLSCNGSSINHKANEYLKSTSDPLQEADTAGSYAHLHAQMFSHSASHNTDDRSKPELFIRSRPSWWRGTPPDLLEKKKKQVVWG